MIWGLFQVLYLVKWPIFHGFSGLDSKGWYLGRNFFGKFVAKFCHQNKLFYALFWYLALETQNYQKSRNLDFPILKRRKKEKRNYRFQKIKISGFLVLDIKKVHKITYFSDKIWHQICQKSFFLGITCQSLDLKNCQKWVLLLHKVLEISLKSKSVFSKSCLKWKIFVTKVRSEIG